MEWTSAAGARPGAPFHAGFGEVGCADCPLMLLAAGPTRGIGAVAETPAVREHNWNAVAAFDSSRQQHRAPWPYSDDRLDRAQAQLISRRVQIVRIQLRYRTLLFGAAWLIALGVGSSSVYMKMTGGPRTSEEEQVIAAIAAQLASANNQIDLSSVLPQFPWRRVCAIDSYFSKQDFSAAVGKTVAHDRAFWWRNFEHVWTLLLVTEDGDGVVAARVPKREIGYLEQDRMVRCVGRSGVLRISDAPNHGLRFARLESRGGPSTGH